MGPDKSVELVFRPRWILPSLMRPHNVARLIESYHAVGETDAPVTLLIWHDDPFFDSYLALQLPRGWDLVVENFRFTAADAMRWIVAAYPDADAYGFLGDDIVFRTTWWRQLAESAEDCFISYPDDGAHGPQLPTHFVCGRKLVEATGWWALPGLIHSGVDLAWYIIGLNVPGLLRYRDDVKFEHLHPLFHKGQDDEIYKFARSKLPEDSKIFMRWNGGTGLRDAVTKVREVFAQ